jgi:hypothetical protein
MKEYKVNLFLFIILLLVALFFIVVGPFIIIWAINTLFSLNIEYSWTNWLCVLITITTVYITGFKEDN